MAYYTNIFSPETYQAFMNSDKTVSGFRVRQKSLAEKVSVYSGILRMADLLALQPNMNINLHIVAPDSRQEKVFQEIRRPVFSLLDSGPLSERCSYIPYHNLKALSKVKHLDRMTDAVLEDYTEHEEL